MAGINFRDYGQVINFAEDWADLGNSIGENSSILYQLSSSWVQRIETIPPTEWDGTTYYIYMENNLGVIEVYTSLDDEIEGVMLYHNGNLEATLS